ncbi:unnamed protein product [Aphanomyces euteiches]
MDNYSKEVYNLDFFMRDDGTRRLLTNKSTLIRSMVTATGQPIVTLAVAGAQGSILHSFTYDLAMQCWMRVADDSFAYSDFQSHLTSDAVVASDIPVSWTILRRG